MKWLTDSWYQQNLLRWLLLPLSIVYRWIIFLRKQAYQRDILTRHKMPVPVIIVGNISVGGTGKTPFVIWLAEQLKQAGYNPGIISRGYGSKAPSHPFEVSPDSTAKQAGDEPLLIRRRTTCPVIIDPDRSQAAVHLLSHHHCDVIISDDGLQHYALQRDVEITLVDGNRRFGNKLCLPAGPLREPMSRLKTVDFVVYNGSEEKQQYQMQLNAIEWVNLADSTKRLPVNSFANNEVHAIAGIGNPQRFFDLLCDHKMIVHPHAFEDHHAFSASDLNFADDLPLLMTEKDAVKCQPYAQKHHWYLPVSAVINDSLLDAIVKKLKDPANG